MSYWLDTHIRISFVQVEIRNSQSDKMVNMAVNRHAKRKKLKIFVELNILRKFIENLGNT